MLRDLGFRRKMLLLPVLATAAFVAVSAVNEALGASAHAVLRHVERDLAPAVEASRDLEDLLTHLQRALQDAVAAEDAGAVDEARAIPARFHERLAALGYDGRPRAEAERLATEFDALWASAREASARMIARSATEAQLADTSRRFAAMREALAAVTARQRAELAAGFERTRALHRAMALALVVGTLVGVALIALVARSIVRGVVEPVVALSHAAKRVAEGDLAHDPVRVDARDELGDLARSFAAMVERLRALPAALAEAVDELGGAVAEAERAAAQQGCAVEKQVVALARSRTTAERILRESQETTRRAETVLDVAGRIEASGDTAQVAAREGVAGLGDISDQVEQITGGIGQLARHTHTIGELVGTMKRLASDSSELALSVSVEAARAGASGGPLAESARLLKDLASRSSQTSARITRALAEADGALAGIGTLSEESKRRMERGIGQVRASAESLREITAVVQKSGKAARGIVASVTQQGQAIAEITADVVQLDHAMAEALQGSRRAQTSAEALKRTAGRLTALVQSFRV